MKRKHFKIVSLALSASLVCSTTLFAFAFDEHNLSEESLKSDSIFQTVTVDANEDFEKNRSTAPSLVGEKVQLEYPEMPEKNWMEYIEYRNDPYYTFVDENDANLRYKIYMPVDLNSPIMEVSAYKINDLSQNEYKIQIGSDEVDALSYITTMGCLTVLASGGVISGIEGILVQNIFNSVGAGGLQKNAQYYSSEYFTGLSFTGFYNVDSITIAINNSEGYSIQKSTNMNTSNSAGGETKASFGPTLAKVEIASQITNSVSYSLGINNGQSGSTGNSVSMTYSRRRDPEIDNVPWRIVECEAVISMKICQEDRVYNEDGTSEWVKNEDGVWYLKQNLFKTYCREWANGYIEHWGTGNLCFRAEFFEGFLTQEQVKKDAKEKVKEEKVKE